MDRLDIVLPIYNPHETWLPETITRLHALADRFKSCADLQVTLVNDGSYPHRLKPEDMDALKKAVPFLRVIEYTPNGGKGFALRRGVRETAGDYVIYTDFDFPFGLDAVAETFALLKSGADIVAAFRDETYANALKSRRRTLTHLLRWVNRFVLRLEDHDAQAGLKGFNRRGRAVFLRTRINSFLFDTEFIAMAKRCAGIRVADVHVTLDEGIVLTKKKLYVIAREGFHMLKLMMRALVHFPIALKGIENEIN